MQGESVLRAEVLSAPTGPWEGYCEESSVEIGQARVPEGEQYLVLTKGAGIVLSESPAVTSRDVDAPAPPRSEEHTSELQSRFDLVCRLLLEKKKKPVNDATS